MSAVRLTIVDQAGGNAGGAEETLLAFLRHSSGSFEPRAVLFEDGNFAARLRDLGVQTTIVPLSRAISSAKRERLGLAPALALPVAMQRLARVMVDLRTELVYTNSMKAHIVGGAAACVTRVPCAMYFHDLPDGLALRALRLAAKVASRSRMACSRIVRDRMALGATTIVYPPIDLDRFATLRPRAQARLRLGIPPDGPLTVLVGRINRWKGHDRFLRVAKRVVAACPSARFAVVGAPIFRDAEYLTELRARSAALGLDGSMTFVPWLDDVADVYAASDVNVNCSTREPFGRAVTEAAACGVPTVCFNDSGAAETLDGSTGRAVAAGDEDAMAQSVLDFATDERLRRSAGAAARAAAARFDARVIGPSIERVLRTAAA